MRSYTNSVGGLNVCGLAALVLTIIPVVYTEAQTTRLSGLEMETIRQKGGWMIWDRDSALLYADCVRHGFAIFLGALMD